MTRHEHLMTIAMEECAEVAQRISKAQRFGMGQVQQDADDHPEQNPERLTNRERIIAEFGDLVAALEMLDLLVVSTTGAVYVNVNAVRAKQTKVEHYFQRSIANGTLQESR